MFIPAARCLAPHLRNPRAFHKTAGAGPRHPGAVVPNRFPGARPERISLPAEAGVRCGVPARHHGERPHRPSHPPDGRRHRRQPRQPARRPGSHPQGAPQPLRRQRRNSHRYGPLERRRLGGSIRPARLHALPGTSDRHAGRAGNPPAAGLPHLPAVREHDPRHPRRTRRAVRCELCTARSPSEPTSPTTPQRPGHTWAMKVTTGNRRSALQEMIPVMAALSVFETACGKCACPARACSTSSASN